MALPSTLALCVSPDIGMKFSLVNFITSKGNYLEFVNFIISKGNYLEFEKQKRNQQQQQKKLLHCSYSSIRMRLPQCYPSKAK